MKLNCLNCNAEFEGGIYGWHNICPECGCSFDVDISEGKIVMAFTDPVIDKEIVNIDIAEFTQKFKEKHMLLYNNNDNIRGYREAFSAGHKLLSHPSEPVKEFVREFVKYRGKIISSNREMAAFMFALDDMI